MSFRSQKKKSLPSPTCPLAVEVLLRPSRSNDAQSDVGSTVCSPLRSSLRLWPLTLDPDWTTDPLWRRPLLSWTPGHKSSPGGESRCWAAAASRRLGCGSGLDWALRYQYPGKGWKISSREVHSLNWQLQQVYYVDWFGIGMVRNTNRGQFIHSHILELCLGIFCGRFGALFGLLYYAGIKYTLLMLTGV